VAGETALSANSYTTGTAAGDQLTMYCEDSEDVRCTASSPPVGDATVGTGFGGPHLGGCNYVYCDPPWNL